MPFELFLYLFIRLDISNYDVMLDCFLDHGKEGKMEPKLLRQAQTKLNEIKERFQLDEYLDNWWDLAKNRVDRLLLGT